MCRWNARSARVVRYGAAGALIQHRARSARSTYANPLRFLFETTRFAFPGTPTASLLSRIDRIESRPRHLDPAGSPAAAILIQTGAALRFPACRAIALAKADYLFKIGASK